MQVVLCDTCHLALDGRTLEMHLFFGEAFSTHDGRARVAHRGTSKVFNLCQGCGTWLEGALKHLRESQERRATPRFTVAIDVVGRVRGPSSAGDTTFRARTVNLSQGGAALSTEADIPAGTEVTLRFFPDDDAPFELQGVVLPRLSATSNEGESPLRVRFVDGDDDALDRLSMLLQRARRRQ